ncbi:MAG TPA: hypothetical protein VF952_19770 [Chloroflexia bacterium]|jgi:hypothetical protein
MSYLNPLRLHFAGIFQAAPSTVNNDITHFNNATFKPEYQQRGTPGRPNGSWNPGGAADWRFIGCKVTAAYANGSPATPADPVLTYLVADSDRRVAAKLVDLDPEQQLVSGIWGFEVRICDPNGGNLMVGRFEPASFMDLWQRAVARNASDFMLGAMYQSVLTNLEWGDVSQSPFLTELRNAASDGLLSIKFNIDGYDMDYTSPDFTRGRVVGTIGPASASEPRHCVIGRQFIGENPPQNADPSQGTIGFCTAVVDQQRGKVLLDLGNALPTTIPGGPLVTVRPLSLGYADTDGNLVSLGSIPYSAHGWYETTAGIADLPTDRNLTPQELQAIATNPLVVLAGAQGSTQLTATASEASDGLNVRADQFVFRLDPGESAEVNLAATRFGQPVAAGTNVNLSFYNDQLQGGRGLPTPGVPATALTFDASVPTGPDGVATATVQASDPGNPRGYIDGQVYGIRPTLGGVADDANPWNFISLLVWDAFTSDEPPTWWGSLQPIFQQYANLYPVMGTFLNLADYDSVCENLDLLRLAFNLEEDNPNLMPVTRDLSTSKHDTIIRWLNETGPDGKPLLGTPPPPHADEALEALARAAVAPEAEVVDEGSKYQLQGGKTAALKRRLVAAAAD